MLYSKEDKKLGGYHIMFVYYVKIDYDSDLTDLVHFVPGSRRKSVNSTSFGPVFAYSLLLLVLNRHYCVRNLGSIEYTSAGKPFLTDRSDIHFSLSHTDTHCLCALSNNTVGADVQTHRSIIPSLPQRVLGFGEIPERFFDYWTLKEAFIKLLGNKDRPYQEISFSLTEDSAFSGDVHGHVYREIPGCSAAVCAVGQFQRPILTEISPYELKRAIMDINDQDNKKA